MLFRNIGRPSIKNSPPNLLVCVLVSNTQKKHTPDKIFTSPDLPTRIDHDRIFYKNQNLPLDTLNAILTTLLEYSQPHSEKLSLKIQKRLWTLSFSSKMFSPTVIFIWQLRQKFSAEFPQIFCSISELKLDQNCYNFFAKIRSRHVECRRPQLSSRILEKHFFISFYENIFSKHNATKTFFSLDFAEIWYTLLWNFFIEFVHQGLSPQPAFQKSFLNVSLFFCESDLWHAKKPKWNF